MKQSPDITVRVRRADREAIAKHGLYPFQALHNYAQLLNERPCLDSHPEEGRDYFQGNIEGRPVMGYKCFRCNEYVIIAIKNVEA